MRSRLGVGDESLSFSQHEGQGLRAGPRRRPPKRADRAVVSDAKLFANRSALFANHAESAMVLLAFGELRQTNIDLGLAGNARIVANAADPFDAPEQIVIRERINCVNTLAHWQIITESESIKESRGRSRSQSYSQIALLHSHFFSARSAHIRRYFWNGHWAIVCRAPPPYARDTAKMHLIIRVCLQMPLPSRNRLRR